MPLGRLEEVNLREVWKSEPYDFTPWLAEAENLQFLADSLELPGLQLVRTEHPVDSFSADIVCKVIDTDSFVLIENQLEKTDHVHAGQILTYAAKFDARIIVWIAQRFTEAHRASIDWLNHITDDQYGFFGVEVRAVRIGTSDVAPLFDVVAKPNEWTKPKAAGAAKQAELSDYNLANINFWNLFDAALDDDGKIKRRIKKEVKGPNFWIPLSSDGAVYLVCFRSMSGNPRVGCYLAIYGEQLQHYSEALKGLNPQVASETLSSGTWALNSKGSVETFSLPSIPITQESQANVIETLVARVNALASVFSDPVLKAQASKPSLG